jgi:hypothetical protein
MFNHASHYIKLISKIIYALLILNQTGGLLFVLLPITLYQKIALAKVLSGQV